MGISFAALIMTTHLVIFHLWLMKHGITTFDYIMYNREKKEMQLELKVFLKVLKSIVRFDDPKSI